MCNTSAQAIEQSNLEGAKIYAAVCWFLSTISLSSYVSLKHLVAFHLTFLNMSRMQFEKRTSRFSFLRYHHELKGFVAVVNWVWFQCITQTCIINNNNNNSSEMYHCPCPSSCMHCFAGSSKGSNRCKHEWIDKKYEGSCQRHEPSSWQYEPWNGECLDTRASRHSLNLCV